MAGLVHLPYRNFDTSILQFIPPPRIPPFSRSTAPAAVPRYGLIHQSQACQAAQIEQALLRFATRAR